MRRLLRLLLALAALLAPALGCADPQFTLLVIAAPSKYHYEYIPVARESLERLGRLHAFALDWRKDGAALEGDLGRYAAILMLNTPADAFTPAQRAGFERYMAGGGNAMVVHRAAIVPAGAWPWYEKLVGRSFVNHPMIQTGVVTVLDKDFPATFGLPMRWLWSDEFYVTTNPFDIAIHRVLGVDETSYDPMRIWPGQVGHRMGKDHPEAWYHGVGKGRVFVTLLGHEAEMYRDDRYLQHLLGGILWTATGLGIQP
ncbi:ThuA domain-containing protein [uncultured Sphingomonas sp.]|uniref:ThuA domain-containing protein n=1 Tax=uncultured Sphingomonas sp. TaxID=158754 RepID=UPI0025CE0649|nr:ThuA domain-containing protein [uncultured Sphingomonas sp.]